MKVNCTVKDVRSDAASIPASQTLVLPAALEEIGAEAFLGASMQKVTIPNGVKKIGSRAFALCPNLLAIVIPDSVETIADDAFAGVSNLTVICGDTSAAHTFAVQHGFFTVAP